MKTGWQTAFILTVGLGATVAYYVAAVSVVDTRVDTGSGRLFVPPISPAELVLTVETGSGSLRQMVTEEASYMELLFEHNQKGLSLAQYMAKVTDDGDFRLLADSMTRRYREDLLQIRKWLREWYGIEKPLPGQAPLAVPVDAMTMQEAHRAFIEYQLRHHTWASAMTRIAQTRTLREEMKDFTRRTLRLHRLEEDALRHMLQRF